MTNPTDITTAINDLVDKLKTAEETNQKHREDIATMVDKINQLEVELIAINKERQTWIDTAESREKELDLYINRKIVGQEMIDDYFGKIFEKELDKYLGHLHHSKKSRAEELLSLPEDRRKQVQDMRDIMEARIQETIDGIYD